MDFPNIFLEIFIPHISYYDAADLNNACIFMLSVCVWEWPNSYKNIAVI